MTYMAGFQPGTSDTTSAAGEGSYAVRLTGSADAGFERWPWRLESTEIDGESQVRVWLAEVEVIRVRGRGVVVDLLDAALDGRLSVMESNEIDPDYS